MAGGWTFAHAYAAGTAVARSVSASNGAALTTGGSQWAKGTWQQLNASLPQDCNGIMLHINVFPSNGNVANIDVAVGASGSESKIISDLIQFQVGPQTARYIFPMVLKAGTRLSARVGTNYAGTDTVYVAVSSWDSDYQEGQTNCAIDGIGWAEANIHGTQIDPGGTANTKSAWVTIINSTAADYRGLVMSFDNAGGLPTGSALAWYGGLLDIAIGGAGSEQPILSNFPIKSQMYKGCGYAPGNTVFLPLPIPAGVRVAARFQSANTTATYRILGLSLSNPRG